jgi:hypothetical protein
MLLRSNWQVYLMAAKGLHKISLLLLRLCNRWLRRDVRHRGCKELKLPFWLLLGSVHRWMMWPRTNSQLNFRWRRRKKDLDALDVGRPDTV